ncbi:MAG: acyl-CoA thioesterase [Desulfovibrio sp.]|nr:MAG: acyl-CoA thioesterase [Desulfovibrio sp.]
MQAKPVSQSQVVMSYRVLPQDTNPAGNIHGGVILKHIDSAAGVVAARHCRTNVVTASIDSMSFLEPIFVGELVTFMASPNFVGTSSMEIGVRVEAENLLTGHVRHTATAYLTYVSLDEARNPVPIPKLIMETEEQKRRHEEACLRRKARLEARKRGKKSKND